MYSEATTKTIPTKVVEQFFPPLHGAVCLMLYQVVLTYEAVDEILKLKCDHSNESRVFPVVLLVTFYKVVLTFDSVGEILSLTIQKKATEQYFLVALFIMLYNMVLTFESVDEILNCDHSKESY